MLTDKQCRAADTNGKSKLFDGHGLYLEILKSGARSWRWKYRHDGKEKRLTFGLYPVVSLREARVAREKAAALLREGIDPAPSRNTTPAIVEPTFEAVARDWHTLQTKVFEPKHAKRVLSSFERDIFPAVGHLPITAITSAQIVALLRKVEARGSADVAHRTRQRISDVFVFALAGGIGSSNPAASMAKALGKVVHRHYPAAQTIEAARELLATVEKRPLYPLTRIASRLLALTAVRSGPLRLAEVHEFEGLDGPAPIWRIPATKMKLPFERRNDPAFEFIVPLSRQAVEVVKAAIAFNATDGLIFRSIRFAKQPISDATISKAYRDAGYTGIHVPHGWRSTYSTVMNRLAAEQGRPGDREVIDLMLAHIDGSTEAIYNRYAYMMRRRELLQEWADLLSVGLIEPAQLVDGPRHS